MTRAEITRRKELAERMARTLCIMRGINPDAVERMFPTMNGASIGPPNWVRMRPTARRMLAATEWLEEPA